MVSGLLVYERKVQEKGGMVMKKIGAAAVVLIMISLCLDVSKHTEQIEKLNKEIEELKGEKGEAAKGE